MDGRDKPGHDDESVTRGNFAFTPHLAPSTARIEMRHHADTLSRNAV